MKYDSFIAVPMSILNKYEYQDVKKNVQNISEKANVYSQILNLNYTSYENNEVTEFAMIEDFKAIDESENFILYLPGQIYSSVLVEVGYAIAKNKNISIFCYQESDLPHLLKKSFMNKNIKLYFINEHSLEYLYMTWIHKSEKNNEQKTIKN